jgi:hypothetical protein
MWISIKKLVLGSILLMTDHQIYSIWFQLRQWRMKTNQNKIKRRKAHPSGSQSGCTAVPIGRGGARATSMAPGRGRPAAPACPCGICGAWPWPPVRRLVVCAAPARLNPTTPTNQIQQVICSKIWHGLSLFWYANQSSTTISYQRGQFR